MHASQATGASAVAPSFTTLVDGHGPDTLINPNSRKPPSTGFTCASVSQNTGRLEGRELADVAARFAAYHYELQSERGLLVLVNLVCLSGGTMMVTEYLTSLNLCLGHSVAEQIEMTLFSHHSYRVQSVAQMQPTALGRRWTYWLAAFDTSIW